MATLADGVNLLDGKGRLVGRYDVAKNEAVVGADHLPLLTAFTISGRRLDFHLPINQLKQAELRGDDLWIDGHPFGRVDGITGSSDDMRNLGAMLVGMLVFPQPEPRTDAVVPDTTGSEAPAPPPPPPPR